MSRLTTRAISLSVFTVLVAAATLPMGSVAAEAASAPASAPVSSPAPAPAHATSAASSITPTDAQRAVAVLENPPQRAAAVRTLKAIADASPAASKGASGAASASDAAAASAADAQAEAASAASAASAPPAIVPLEANGLTAQLLRQIAHWVDGLSDQLSKLGHAVIALPAFGTWLRTTFGSPQGQALLVKAATALLAVFAIGLALEWLLRRALQRPRKALIAHAEEVERRARARRFQELEARRVSAERVAKEQAREAANAAGSTDATSAADANADADADDPTQPMSAADIALAAAAADAAEVKPGAAAAAKTANAEVAGVKAPPGDIALIRTQVDGTERVEAVRVDAGDGASGSAAAKAVEAAVDSGGTVSEKPAAPQPAQHWSTLRHLPYAIGTLVLDLLPLLLFFCAAGLVLRWLAGEQGPVQDMTGGFIDAYLTVRVTMAVVRLLVSPVGHGLRVLRVSPEMSHVVEVWVRRIVVVASFGVAIAKGAGAFGAGHEGQVAFMKVVSLIVHVSVVVLIFHCRRSVGAAIAARPDAGGAVSAVRNWLADVWAIFASFVVMAVWVVWALGVEDGFPKLIHFIGVSVGVIVGARLLAILVLGALGRAFHPDSSDGDGADTSARGRLASRYYPIVRSVVSAIIIVCAVIGLLEVWGFDAIAWFTRGPVGRNLTSAALTIAVAAIVAVAVWEAANIGVERRLARWNQRGDVVRAARLRTLLPMLRTCLFIVIVLIVGLTALNEIGINTTPMLAGASIIGVALGFGSQKLVQDFITGIFLLMENAMQVGDWVTVAGVSGSVEYLSIRTVRLRAGDGSLHIVPFSSVSTVNNTNRGIGNAAVKVSVSYDSDIDQVIDELKQIGAGIRSDPAFKDLTLGDLELWGVDSVDGAMVTIAGQIRCLDKGRWGVQRAFNRRMFERFRELGIEIANPRASLLLPADGLLEARAPLGPDGRQSGAAKTGEPKTAEPETPNVAGKKTPGDA